MDHGVLKKRLNTFKSSSGKLKNVSDEVVMEVLRSWENWPGSSADLYRELGLSKMQLVILLKKGKNLVKSGAVLESEFKEVKISSPPTDPVCSSAITVKWEKGRVIRFSQVHQLVEFLNIMESKKVA